MSLYSLYEILKKLAWAGLLKLEKTPSYVTIRRWINQIGYYKLTRAKKKANDWFYLIDNNIRLENGKVCLILGGHLSKLKRGKYLSFEDVDAIEMRVCKNSEEVKATIESAIKKTGEPVMIASDEGGDVLPVIQEVIASHPSIQHISEVCHKVANLLEKILSKDKRWQFFFTSVTLSRNRLKGSTLSHLSPPTTKKFKFLSYSKIVNWAIKAIEMLKNLEKTDENREKIYEKLGWLLAIESDIKMFAEIMTIGESAKQTIRKNHIQAKMKISFKAHTSEGKRYIKEIEEYLKTQVSKVPKNQLFVGSTEIIESAFNKLKQLSPENQGFTGSIIGLAACFGKLRFKDVVQAFEGNLYEKVKQWEAQNIGQTFLSKRRQMLKPVKINGNKNDAIYSRKKARKVA